MTKAPSERPGRKTAKRSTSTAKSALSFRGHAKLISAIHSAQNFRIAKKVGVISKDNRADLINEYFDIAAEIGISKVKAQAYMNVIVPYLLDGYVDKAKARNEHRERLLVEGFSRASATTPAPAPGRKAVGNVSNAQVKKETAKASEAELHLNRYLEAEGVAWRFRPTLVREIRRLVARTARPKWNERLDHLDLRELSAPDFLKRVHAEDIRDGVVNKEAIRAIDPDLMAAVESYIAGRKRRGRDFGDASDLTFELSRPAPNALPAAQPGVKRL